MTEDAGRAPLRKGAELQVAIESLGDGADGFARVDGHPLFVRGALPGERVVARVVAVHESHARADLVRIEVAAPERVPPICPHFGTCGGCRTQHVGPGASAVFARERLAGALRRHLGDDAPEVGAPVPLGADERARCRLVMRFATSRGELVAGLPDIQGRGLVGIADCPAAAPAASTVARAIAYEAIARRLTALRAVAVHTSSDGAHVHATLVAETARLPHAQRLVDAARAQGATAVTLNQHEGRGTRTFGRRTVALAGLPYVVERTGDLRFRLSTTTAYEVTHTAAARIGEAVLRAAAIEGGERALDLFAGSGRFALAMARAGATVVGVDVDHQAMRDADASATDLDLDERTRFVPGRVEKELLALERPRPDVVVLDPPASGTDAALTAGIARVLAPRRIVLVGRDTGTFARELGRFRELGFATDRVELFDADPFTIGVAAVATLRRDG